MSKTFSVRNLFAASAFAAVASVSLFSGSGTASAGILDCKGNTAGAVMACCQEEVKRNGRPMWMRVNQQNCNKQDVRCSRQDRRCWYKPQSFAKLDNNDKHKDSSRDSSRGQGGKY